MAALPEAEQGPKAPLIVTVFADFACPFSYVTEEALRRIEAYPGTDDDAASSASPRIEVVYRAYELFPEPVPLDPPDYGDIEWATVSRLGMLLELEFRRPGFRPRTRKAHEAAFFARERGVEADVRRAIFSAYWGDGEDIGRIDVLMALVAPVGLDPEELRIALDIDRQRDAVLHDQSVAQRLRIRGTPTVFIGSGPTARVVAGAMSEAELGALIRESGGGAESR